MKLVWCILVLSFLLLSCENISTEQAISQIKVDTIEYGVWTSISETDVTEIIISDFTEYFVFLEHIDSITCEGKQAIIQFDSEKGLKKFYPVTPCSWDIVCVSKRNFIEVTKDSIFKADNSYPLDSLSTIMRLDYNNHGLKSDWSISPSKVALHLSLDNEDILYLIPMLEKITESYDEIELNTGLKVWLGRDYFTNLKTPIEY